MDEPEPREPKCAECPHRDNPDQPCLCYLPRMDPAVARRIAEAARGIEAPGPPSGKG